MSDEFYVWGGRFETTAKAWGTPPSAKDILDSFESHGPFVTEAAADQTWLGVTRKNVDICSHRMLVTKLDSDAAPVFLAGLLADYVQGQGSRGAARFWRGVKDSSALLVLSSKDAPTKEVSGFSAMAPRDAATRHLQEMQFFT